MDRSKRVRWLGSKPTILKKVTPAQIKPGLKVTQKDFGLGNLAKLLPILNNRFLQKSTIFVLMPQEANFSTIDGLHRSLLEKYDLFLDFVPAANNASGLMCICSANLVTFRKTCIIYWI